VIMQDGTNELNHDLLLLPCTLDSTVSSSEIGMSYRGLMAMALKAQLSSVVTIASDLRRMLDGVLWWC
jgi:hypothetical protein